MVKTKIKDIDLKKLKYAKGAVALLELLGIDEEDLLLLKEIPAMKQELAELREFKKEVIRTIETKNNSTAKPLAEISKGYLKPIKEFNPHYEQD